MLLLTGHHPRTLDEKNRVQIPAEFRAEFGGDSGEELVLHVIPGFRTNTLSIYTRSSLETLLTRTSARPKMLASAGDLDLLWAFAPAAEVDKQGRLVLPPRLLAERTLGKDVMLVGQVDHIDVWRADEFEQYSKEWFRDQWPALQALLRAGSPPDGGKPG